MARIEAAEISGTRWSPFTSAKQATATSGTWSPSTTTSSGACCSISTARFIASSVARRMFRRSISSTEATATAQASARSRIATASASRVGSLSCLESASPSMGRAGSRITAAANTAPASGPRPASSTPQSRAAVVG